jgi:hypothetical protein
MKSECLLRRKRVPHDTAWVDSAATKLGLFVEIPELGGLWEIIEKYPYRLSDKQLCTEGNPADSAVPLRGRRRVGE